MYVADSKRLTHEGAKMMIDTAVAKARAAGIAISCAVVDAGGHLVAFERMDGGRFHTQHSATTKAVCAASNKRITSAKGAVGQDLDTNHALGLALAAGPERWTAMEGGAPVLIGGECIGGIGVSGGDWATDERLAREAVEAIRASWK
ncbi:MAG TPA: heme-binding protein [Xanthobacteraceae bacterium]|nr:heme-binding protein [Xanthobacteraceae bacterium]